MKHNKFTLIEVLVATAMLALFLNGVVLLSGQILSVHKQHGVSATQTATEDLLAKRWHRFAGSCDATAAPAIDAGKLGIGERQARIDADGVWLNGVLTPLPSNVSAVFAVDKSDPALLVLSLRIDSNNADQNLRMVARRATLGVTK